MSELEYGVARGSEEFKQIRELNYRTFVEEIPQHESNGTGYLKDRFEEESTYLVCRSSEKILGMVAIRCNRPFSLDAKLDDLDSYLPPHNSVCEVRLLAVEASKRNSRVLSGLFRTVCQFCLVRGHDLAVISGTLRQAKLYQHMGFTPFGPIVGTEEASYQPMWLSVNELTFQSMKLESELLGNAIKKEINLLPGPVDLSSSVESALNGRSISHRGSLFRDIFEESCDILSNMTGAEQVSIAGGGGTLANDLVAGQFLQVEGKGLILRNGEFGHRLSDHASRFNLSYETFDIPWGKAFKPSEIENKLKTAKFSWIWTTHAETSTGVLNDLNMLKEITAKYGVKLCLDCVSSLGVVPCDLNKVFLASGASGKGLRSLAGLAIVFHRKSLPEQVKSLPRYLDLKKYASERIPFTLPSRLIVALHVSLESLAADNFSFPTLKATKMRQELIDLGFEVLAEENDWFPGVLTIVLPDNVDAFYLGSKLENLGWTLNFRSDYLQKKNLLQISFIGLGEGSNPEPLPNLLKNLVKKASK